MSVFFCLSGFLGTGCKIQASMSDSKIPEISDIPENSVPAPGEGEFRGQLVCLLEEVTRLHGVEIPPVHQHLTGIRTEDDQLYTLLRTSTAGFLFTDQRFQGRTLVLTGRTFLPSRLLEVTRVDWLQDGAVYEVYYWCEECSIKGVKPGTCACCQMPVELRQRPRNGGKETIIAELQ